MKSRTITKIIIVFSICVVFLCSCNDSLQSLKVGKKTPRGGYLFYDKGEYSDGWRYLEAAPAGWYGTTWDPLMKFANINGYLGVTSEVIGSGKENTDALLSSLGAGSRAARACENYSLISKNVKYDDWFLPSLEELIKIKTNLCNKGLGGFYNWVYWSSSEWIDDANNKASGVFLNDDLYVISIYHSYRDTEYRVRPVRRF